MEQMKGEWLSRETFPFQMNRHIYYETVTHRQDLQKVELVFVVSGEAQHYYDNKTYWIRTGDVFVVNPGEEHSYAVGLGMRLELLTCQFTASLVYGALMQEHGLSQALDYFYVHPFLNADDRFKNRLNLDGQDAAICSSLLERMLRESNERQPGFGLMVRLQMLELLLLLSRKYASYNKERVGFEKEAKDMKDIKTRRNRYVVKQICGYLRRHHEQKIALPALSMLFDVSVRQLNRFFQQEMNCSVIEKLHLIRIEQAKQLLVETEDKIVVIAGAVGYEDPAFFGQIFARQEGCTPGRYREQALSGANDSL